MKLAGRNYSITIDATSYDPINRWLYFLLKFDGNFLSAYINGQEIGAEPISGEFLPPDASVWIGAEKTYDNRYFKGAIDDVRIYNYALTESEICELAGNQCRD